MNGGRASTVTLQEINADTVRTITSLEVLPEQRNYVASNAVSMSQAHFNKGAWFRAVYADETPVGFVMLFDATLPGAEPDDETAANELWIWRFMIDHRYQRNGLGRQALDLIRAHALARPGIDILCTSYVPGADGPEGFYLGYGFAKTGKIIDDEIVVCIKLR